MKQGAVPTKTINTASGEHGQPAAAAAAVSISCNDPIKDDDDDNDEDDEDDVKLQSSGIDPDRLKAFNVGLCSS